MKNLDNGLETLQNNNSSFPKMMGIFKFVKEIDQIQIPRKHYDTIKKGDRINIRTTTYGGHKKREHLLSGTVLAIAEYEEKESGHWTNTLHFARVQLDHGITFYVEVIGDTLSGYIPPSK